MITRVPSVRSALTGEGRLLHGPPLAVCPALAACLPVHSVVPAGHTPSATGTLHGFCSQGPPLEARPPLAAPGWSTVAYGATRSLLDPSVVSVTPLLVLRAMLGTGSSAPSTGRHIVRSRWPPGTCGRGQRSSLRLRIWVLGPKSSTAADTDCPGWLPLSRGASASSLSPQGQD